MILPPRHSRLIGNRLGTDADGRELYDLRVPMRFEALQGAVPVVLRAGDSLHQIAWDYYGNAQLWWAIADFNGIFDVTTELRPGRTILVPPRDAIETHLTQGA